MSGFAPAVQATKRELQEGLREGGRGNTGTRALVRNTLVVAQISLALVALVGALLFVRSFRNLDTYELGFDTGSVLMLRFYMTGDHYLPDGAKSRRVEDIITRVGSLPGVEAAFASNWIPIAGGGGGPIEVDQLTAALGGQPRDSAGRRRGDVRARGAVAPISCLTHVVTPADHRSLFTSGRLLPGTRARIRRSSRGERRLHATA